MSEQAKPISLGGKKEEKPAKTLKDAVLNQLFSTMTTPKTTASLDDLAEKKKE